MTTDIPDIDGDWSPRLCPQVIGQERAAQRLYGNFLAGKLHHGWLLTGIKGIGKASFAWQAARFLLHHKTAGHLLSQSASPENNADNINEMTDANNMADTNNNADINNVSGTNSTTEKTAAPDLTIPPESQTARLVRQNAHPDLLVVTRPWDRQAKRFRKRIPIDSICPINRFFSLTAGMNGMRICIIDSLDEMTPEAMNGVLKILEEPPEGGMFFLISHQPGAALDTIRSRCQAVAMQPLRPEVVVQLLKEKLADIDDAEAAAIADLAHGSIGQALQIADGGGLTLYHDLTALLAGLPNVDLEQLHQFAARIAGRQQADLFSLYSALMQGWLHRLIRTLATKNRPFAAADMTRGEASGEQAHLLRLAACVSLTQWVDVWEKIVMLHRDCLRLNLDKKQTVMEDFGLLRDVMTTKLSA